MSTPIIVTCPACKKEIKAPAELLGKKVRCKSCNHTFVAKAVHREDAASPPGASGAAAPSKKTSKDKSKPPRSATSKPKKPAIDDEDDSNPYSMTETELAPRCPHCAKEMESDEQVICLNCGYNTRTRILISTVQTYEITGFDRFLWLAPGILCALAVLSLLGAIVFIWAVFPRLEIEYREEWWSFIFGLALRIWTSIFLLFIMFFTGKFAIRRLLLHPKPPEKIKTK